MKVKLTTDRAGWGWEQRAGDVVELPDAEAKRLVQAGQAEPVSGAENAMKPKSQNAMK